MERPRRLLRVLVAGAVAFAAFHGSGFPSAAGQDEVSEAELQRASAGRTLRVGTPGTGRTSDLALEVYVARVLAGEGEPRAADAAQQALAIAIRTYALANEGRHRREGYDLCDTTHCQVLRTSSAASRRAALATAGEVLTFEGHPAELFYSASCGGRSEAASAVWPGADYPYLVSIRDDVHDHDEPWALELDLKQIEEALRRAGFGGRRLTSVDVEARTASGRAGRLRVKGMEPDVVAGEEFRRAVGSTLLRSTAFTVTNSGSRVRFVGRGFGHGVGMCVVGAGRRAQRGESAARILATYYPGLELTPVAAVARPAAPVPATPATVARAPVAPPAAPAVPASGSAVVPRRGSVVVAGSVPAARQSEVERLAVEAHTELSRTLGVSVAPITVELHDTLEDFRLDTGQPWWVSAVAAGTTVDLAPLPVLEQRDGLAAAIRIAIAELLVSQPLAGRPAWVRIGAARYFGRGGVAAGSAPAGRCPSNAELTLAISAAAQRDAEARAEACFARAYRSAGDWRAVR